ncbi:MAG TPA: peptidoglycan DD-metalloendopeptidase family protein [Saprospiraceae bacterium]|nr:peptidoglycan DD-metalloendopeptidase family protein [Saprospiraceae bacterium]
MATKYNVPAGAQLLYFPMKATTVAAGYMNTAYAKAKGYVHYGTDFDSRAAVNYDVLSLGNGVVLGTEKCSNSLCNIAIIRYDKVFIPSTKKVQDLIVRVYHMYTMNIKQGDHVSSLQKIGTVSGADKWANHTHIEIDTDVAHYRYTPQAAESSSALLIRQGATASTMLNPINVLVIHETQTAIIHPLATMVNKLKDTPKYKASQFAFLGAGGITSTPNTSGGSPIRVVNNAQNLILPVNKMKVTCSYKNKAYEVLKVNGTTLGKHYGIDVVGDKTIYGSGKGECLFSGYDNIFGNAVCVKYPEVYQHSTGKTIDVIVKYFHLSTRAIATGDPVTKDTKLGIMGATGLYVTGVHCHVECSTDTVNPFSTPSLSKGNSAHFFRQTAQADSTIDPLSIFHVKASEPDNQSITCTQDAYARADDIVIVPVIQ